MMPRRAATAHADVPFWRAEWSLTGDIRCEGHITRISTLLGQQIAVTRRRSFRPSISASLTLRSEFHHHARGQLRSGSSSNRLKLYTTQHRRCCYKQLSHKVRQPGKASPALRAAESYGGRTTRNRRRILACRNQWEHAGMERRWQLKATQTAFENSRIRVLEDDVAQPDGSPSAYTVIEERCGAVSIVA